MNVDDCVVGCVCVLFVICRVVMYGVLSCVLLYLCVLCLNACVSFICDALCDVVWCWCYAFCVFVL